MDFHYVQFEKGRFSSRSLHKLAILPPENRAYDFERPVQLSLNQPRYINLNKFELLAKLCDSAQEADFGSIRIIGRARAA